MGVAQWVAAAAAVAWRVGCALLRRRRRRQLQRLHPLRHTHTIHTHMAFIDFPFLYRRTLELGFFRTYAIPSISRILSRSASFSRSASKRYDDTDILVRELLMHHVDGDRGSLALSRLNFIHSQYSISNADFLYVLSVFVIEPLEKIPRYGYRKLTDAEQTSLFTLWHDIGTRMGIQGIPSTIPALAEYKEGYEKRHMVYGHANKEIAEITLNMLLSKLPPFSRPIARRFVYAFMDDRLRKAIGYPEQAAWWRTIVHGVLKMHGYCVRWMPPRPLSWAELRIPSGCPVSQGNSFKADALYKLAWQQYEPCTYQEGYRLNVVGAAKPGSLGTPCPGKLLLPVSQCDNHPWPLTTYPAANGPLFFCLNSWPATNSFTSPSE